MKQFQYDQAERERVYLDLIISRIVICKSYRPKFGQGKSVNIEEFAAMYGADPFYSWFGLNNPLMYAAHKAAGGITSLYRQIGTGCEHLFQHIIRDSLGLNPSQTSWSYTVSDSGRKDRQLSLDGRIELSDLAHKDRQRVSAWMQTALDVVGVDRKVAAALKGPVFEIRQGYKSKDAKRQNADIGNAGAAYAKGYFPVAAILSTQIDSDIVTRYQAARWLVLRGFVNNDPTTSTYAFSKQVLGFDLADFLQRHSNTLRQTVEEILQALLSASNEGQDLSSDVGGLNDLDAAEEIE